PSHEPVKAAQLCDRFGTGTKEEMIGIAEKDFDLELAQLFRHHRLHRRLRADRHEDRRLNNSMSSMQPAAAGASIGILGEKLELHFRRDFDPHPALRATLSQWERDWPEDCP